MNSKIEWLIGIALAQLVLIAGVLFFESSSTDEKSAFSGLEEARVHAMEVSDLDTSIRIERGETQWSVGGLLADATKIKDLLDKIITLDGSWPVASSASSAERFEVSNETYQRKLSFFDSEGEILESFLLGTSPSYQKVHARQAGSDEVFSVGLSNYEFGLKKDDWLDKSLLKVDGGITSVQVLSRKDSDQEQKSLVEQDGVWEIEGQLADQAAAKSYVDRFGNLRVLGVAEELGENVSDIKILVDDKELTFGLSVIFDDEGEIEDYVIRSSEVEGSFRLASYVAEQILLTDTDLLPEDLDPEEEI